MNNIRLEIAAAALAMLAGCQDMPMQTPSAPASAQMSVNGVSLPYVAQGAGAPVVFVHGAFSDLRAWEPQREAIARRYRFIAYSQRYFGTAAWPDQGEHFSQQTHIADLIAFVEGLKAGPVFLVGRSYGGLIVVHAALQRPDLVRGVFVQDPPITTLVSDAAVQKQLADERAGLAAVRAAVAGGQEAEAVRLFADWTNAEPGGFDKSPIATQALQFDNARTVKLTLASPPGPPLSCSALAAIKPALAISTGELDRPYYRILSEAAHRCAPASTLVTIPGTRHAASAQNPSAFNEALLNFLAPRS